MQATACAHCGDTLLVDEAQAVPEKISGGGLHEKGALADADGGIGTDPAEPGLQVSDIDPAPLGGQLVEGRPPLASGGHVLPLVLTDGAPRRRCRAGRVLHSAGAADKSFHGSQSATRRTVVPLT